MSNQCSIFAGAVTNEVPSLSINTKTGHFMQENDLYCFGFGVSKDEYDFRLNIIFLDLPVFIHVMIWSDGPHTQFT